MENPINIAIACILGLVLACNAPPPSPKVQTPQEALVTRLVNAVEAAHAFSGIAYQDCDENGNCMLLVFVNRGYAGYSWTIYATCDEFQCEIRSDCN